MVEPSGDLEIEPALTLGIGRSDSNAVCPPWRHLDSLDRPPHPSDTHRPSPARTSNLLALPHAASTHGGANKQAVISTLDFTASGEPATNIQGKRHEVGSTVLPTLPHVANTRGGDFQ